MKEVTQRRIRQEPAKNGEDDPAGFLWREIISGKNRNEHRGDNSGDPILEPCPRQNFLRSNVFHEDPILRRSRASSIQQSQPRISGASALWDSLRWLRGFFF